MHILLLTLNNSLPVFITIAMVLLLRAKGILHKKHSEGIAPLIFKVVLPVFAFRVTYGMSLAFSDWPVLGFILVLNVLQLPLVIFANKYFKLPKKTLASVLLLALAYSVGPVAYPFVQFNFDPGVFNKLVPLDILLFIVMLTFGPLIAAKYDHKNGFDAKAIVKSLVNDPVLIAVTLGFLLNILHVPMPTSFKNTMDFMAAPFTFLVTVLVALSLDKPNQKQLTLLSWITLARFVFAVVVSWLVIVIFKPSVEMAMAIPLTLFMSFSSMPLVYTDRHNLDSEFAAQASLFSRVVILPLYPLLITFVKLLFG
jgi:predicted permease